MKFIALICARGGSKGVPGKNIRLLAGKPLIGWSIHVARQIERISRIIVSTDSAQIAQVAKAQGAEVPFMRPEALAQDNSPEWLVWRHAVEYLQETEGEPFDGLVSIPTTAPLRACEDVINCLDEFEKGEADIVITMTKAHRNPYFNMVTVDENKNAALVIPPANNVFRRQDAPSVFDMTTVTYVARPSFVQQHNGIFEGCVRSVYVPPERSLDIDTELDFKMAEFLIAERIEAGS